jgi:hypothetical protein
LLLVALVAFICFHLFLFFICFFAKFSAFCIMLSEAGRGAARRDRRLTMSAQDEKSRLDFRRFVDNLAAARYQEYLAAPSGGMIQEDTYSGMQQYLLERYEGIEVSHSFMADNGQIFDSIPENQQPALRLSGQAMAETPESPPQAAGQSDRGLLSTAQFDGNRQDRFGNRLLSPPGTVPIRRITIEELSRFGSLRAFSRKAPVGRSGHPRLTPPELTSAVHRYAYAFQSVSHLGCHATINIWDPPVQGQEFSLSQIWCATRSPIVQTVESGWQVWPFKYGSSSPVLFVYWTPDGYNTGACNTANFVVKNQAIVPGAPLTTISTAGGQQWELEMTWQLSNGNWWLYVNQQVVGYFPGTLFGGGPLATGASEVDCGGEAYSADGAWPPMGSGQFASSGGGNAAYQRDVEYFPAGGVSQAANLSAAQPSPACYTAAAGSAAAPWSSYVSFGGPGGNNCDAAAPIVIS